MKKFLLAGAAMLALFGGTATAADLSRAPPPVYRAPPPVYIFNWTGCYIGGNVGGLWARKDWTVVGGDPFFAAGNSFGSHDVNSWLGGVQGGCDYQFAGGFVIGIQGDYDWTDAKGDSSDVLNNAFFGTTGFLDHTRIKSLASVTGRVGYAWDRFLGYVKGGGAWERDEYTIINPAGFTSASASQTRPGWTVGIGGEYAFTNWLTGFAEYNYYDFGKRSVTFLSPGGGVFDIIDVKETKSVVKVGLNLRWGGGTAPVVARY
jgi:outer membrane immunogenic protein